jgi:hypothetical protein
MRHAAGSKQETPNATSQNMTVTKRKCIKSQLTFPSTNIESILVGSISTP